MDAEAGLTTRTHAALLWIERGVLLATLLTLMLVARATAGVVGPGSLRLYWLLLAALVVLWITAAVTERPLRRRPLALDLCLAGAGLWMTLATLVNPEPDTQGLLVWLSGLVLAIYAHRRYRQLFDARLVLVFVVVVLVLQVAVSLVQLYQVGRLLRGEASAEELGISRPERMMVGGGGARTARSVGVLVTANVLGSWLAMLVPISFAAGLDRALKRRWWTAVPLLGLSLATLAILVRNLSRLSLVMGLAAVVAVAALTLIRRGVSWREPAVRLAAAAVALLAVAAAALVVAPHVVGRGDGIGRIVRAKVADLRETVAFRLVLQRAALAAIPERPLLGVGYAASFRVLPTVGDAAASVSPRVVQRYRADAERRYRAHSLPLMLAVDGGLPALLLFFVPVVAALAQYARSFRSLSHEHDGLVTAVAVFLCLGVAYTVVYLGFLWPLSLFLVGCLRGALAT
jgi:hypothetical protein